MCCFQFQGNHEGAEEKSQEKKWKSTVNVDNPSQSHSESEVRQTGLHETLTQKNLFIYLLKKLKVNYNRVWQQS